MKSLIYAPSQKGAPPGRDSFKILDLERSKQISYLASKCGSAVMGTSALRRLPGCPFAYAGRLQPRCALRHQYQSSPI
jgi:hypothetical protein